MQSYISIPNDNVQMFNLCDIANRRYILPDCLELSRKNSSQGERVILRKKNFLNSIVMIQKKICIFYTSKKLIQSTENIWNLFPLSNTCFKLFKKLFT